ncbi:MAG: hypothetical protein V1784_08580, partial [bacterium]
DYEHSVYFHASIKDTESGNYWSGSDLADTSGAFAAELTFEELYGSPVTWDFLQTQTGTLHFQCGPTAILGVCVMTVWPCATITEATLIIEGEFEVATDNQSWGVIKSLYK